MDLLRVRLDGVIARQVEGFPHARDVPVGKKRTDIGRKARLRAHDASFAQGTTTKINVS
ncbi:MAG TPA: hypothetical protein VII40_20765 [Xanthobacteraceae bacterium]